MLRRACPDAGGIGGLWTRPWPLREGASTHLVLVPKNHILSALAPRLGPNTHFCDFAPRRQPSRALTGANKCLIEKSPQSPLRSRQPPPPSRHRRARPLGRRCRVCRRNGVPVIGAPT